jgi:FixJ family two-component response regulator
LTPREREVIEGILEGKLNKLVADDLDIRVRTVETWGGLWGRQSGNARFERGQGKPEDGTIRAG